MAFFTGLVSIAALLYGIGWVAQSDYFLFIRNDILLATTAMFVPIGLSHLRKPEQMMYMVPKFLPSAHVMVLLSGMVEIMLGIGLLFAERRTLAAWGLIPLLIAFFGQHQRCYS
ncbi:DoxX family protein [Spirosoma fluminis]